MSAFDAQLTNTVQLLLHIIYKCVLYQSISQPFILLSIWHVNLKRATCVVHQCCFVASDVWEIQLSKSFFLSNHLYCDKESLKLLHSEWQPQLLAFVYVPELFLFPIRRTEHPVFESHTVNGHITHLRNLTQASHNTFNHHSQDSHWSCTHLQWVTKTAMRLRASSNGLMELLSATLLNKT